MWIRWTFRSFVHAHMVELRGLPGCRTPHDSGVRRGRHLSACCVAQQGFPAIRR